MKEGNVEGLKIVTPFVHSDPRGDFIKNYSGNLGPEIDFNPLESFYSESRKGVLRGMHFLGSDSPNHKLIQIISGSILDVCLDMRKDSPSYLSFQKMRLSRAENSSLFIPSGIAHGFLSLEEGTVVHYLQTGVYNPGHEKGIHYNSFGFDWGLDFPIISEKDKMLPTLKEFLS